MIRPQKPLFLSDYMPDYPEKFCAEKRFSLFSTTASDEEKTFYDTACCCLLFLTTRALCYKSVIHVIYVIME
jgi:hypothetical protein